MKRTIFVMFFLLSLLAYSNQNTKHTINQQVSGTNKQKLDVSEITTEELILRNQDLEMTEIDISGKNFKEKDDKIIVKKNDNKNLKDELAKGIKKSFFGLFD